MYMSAGHPPTPPLTLPAPPHDSHPNKGIIDARRDRASAAAHSRLALAAAAAAAAARASAAACFASASAAWHVQGMSMAFSRVCARHLYHVHVHGM